MKKFKKKFKKFFKFVVFAFGVLKFFVEAKEIFDFFKALWMQLGCLSGGAYLPRFSSDLA